MRFIRSVTALAVSGGLAVFGLMTASVASAGTYTAGSWELIAPSTDSVTAQVQQPINADSSSIFSNKTRTIPVKYKVTDTKSFAYESVLKGDSGIKPVTDTTSSAYTGWSGIYYTMPAGVTVNDLTGLTADFTWAFGENHGGGFRWQIGTPNGNIMVDYGDASASLQGGTAGSGTNMVNSALATENRCESNQVGGTMYTPWSYVVANYGNLPVTYVGLVVDGGWGSGPLGTSDQVINLTDATVTYNGGTSTFTWPGAVTTTGNSTPAYIYVAKVSSSPPPLQIDESLITNTQGDTGGQFRPVDGMYMYNFPVSQLPDLTGTYQFGIMLGSSSATPAGPVTLSIK